MALQHRLQRFVGWRRYLDEDGFTVGAAPVHAVQHQAVQVDVELGRRPEALDERDRVAMLLQGMRLQLPEQPPPKIAAVTVRQRTSIAPAV